MKTIHYIALLCLIVIALATPTVQDHFIAKYAKEERDAIVAAEKSKAKADLVFDLKIQFDLAVENLEKKIGRSVKDVGIIDQNELPEVYSYRLREFRNRLFGETAEDIRKDIIQSFRMVLITDELVGDQKWNDLDLPALRDGLVRQTNETRQVAREHAAARLDEILNRIGEKQNAIKDLTWEIISKERKEQLRYDGRLEWN